MAQITIKLDVEIHERLKESARRDSRTVSGQIDYLLKNRIILENIAEKLQETPAGSEKKSLNPAGSGMVKIDTRGVQYSKNIGVNENGHIVPEKNGDFGEMPCCKAKSPCRHWSFDGEAWKNSLSGRIREVE